MAEASDGRTSPESNSEAERRPHPPAAAASVKEEGPSVAMDNGIPTLGAEAAALVSDEGAATTGKLTAGSMRRCGLCGGSYDGEPALETPSDVPVNQGSAGSQLQDESCPVDGTSECKKADGFGTDKGWLGRLLGPLGEHVGVAGAWVHENCAIWSPEVYFSGIGRLKNVKAAVRRGRYLRCSRCNHQGATIGCRVDRCPQNYHLPCARAEGCMFNHRKYLMACYDHSYLFRTKRKKTFWRSKVMCGQGGATNSARLDWPRISKAQRRAAASAARLKDIEAEDKYLDKSGEDEEFVRRERKRLLRDLAQIAPVKLGGNSTEKSPSFCHEGWDSVAGLQDVVQCLKEMVTLPLLYPEAFQRLGISPPRGVLLHGHPGTGKTLVVRALAGACSRGGQQVAYFARKGADILGKYVGDSERQLRLLFQVAEQCQPAIIFFDEIDGLAPSRCGDRDQTQSSVVSTLLALMDGLSSRGSVVVIGATNRPDSLDPALRRPGRFDREIYFPLPSTADRAAILRLHTRTWIPAPSLEILSVVAKATPGFAGADLQALCVEAAMTALRRVVPLQKILDAAEKGFLETKLPSLPSIQVKARDWASAVAHAPLPCSRRLASTSLTQVPAAPLPRHLVPALVPNLVEVLVKLGLDSRVSLPPSILKAFLSIALALKTARSSNALNGIISDKGVGFPEDWLTMVQECFKQTPTNLGIALEDALTNAGIITETYGMARFTRPISTVLFPNNVNGVTDNHVETCINGRYRTGCRTPSSTVQVLGDDFLDELDGAAKQKWQGGKFQVLLLGDAKQGQRFVAGAFCHGFEGLAQMRTLSLPAMLMDGGGDVEQGLIYIIGEARRSVPCLVYMPKIEDWVVNREHVVEEQNRGPPNKHKQSVSGRSHEAAGICLSNDSSQIKLEHEDAGVLEVSTAWKLMKQQLQIMPPDTNIMLLATCEAGAGALPTEVLNFFSPELARASSKSSPSPAKMSPCVCVQLPTLHDPKDLLDRASQDVARALATGFGSRVARLREEYNAGASEEKPKMITAASVKLSTSVQRIIAERVSHLWTRVQEDLGRDLRDIGQDWARNLGKDTERTYANDLAKVFGMDVGRGLGIDLESEIRDLGSGLVEELNKEMRGMDVEKEIRRSDVGSNLGEEALRTKIIQHDVQNLLDVCGEEPHGSTHIKDTRNRDLVKLPSLFGTVNCGENQHFARIDHLRDDCATQDMCPSADHATDALNQPEVGKELEGQTTSDLEGRLMTGVSNEPVIVDSPSTWSVQRKALQSAIAFCGYRLLRDPQLAELRSATATLRSVPTVNVHEQDGVETFDWETLEFLTSSGLRRDEKVPEPEYVRGLTAVGLKAQRGVYQTGREVEFELRRVIESLYERVQHKIDNGKDSLRYFHLTTQAATLLDLMASWVFEVRKLETAANMHNVPISRSILEFKDPEEQQELQDSDPSPSQERVESILVEAVDAEHQAGLVVMAALGACEGSNEQAKCLDEGNVPLQGPKILSGDECAQTSDVSPDPLLKHRGFSDDVLTTSRNLREQTKADRISEGAPGSASPTRNGGHREFGALSAENINCKLAMSTHSNGVQSQEDSIIVNTKIVREASVANSNLPLLCRASVRPEASLQEGTPICATMPAEASTPMSPVSRRKTTQQSVRFKSECLRQLESVIKDFLNLSWKEQGAGASVEALHDLVTGCAASVLAASQNVLCKSERTKTAHQVILQWAGLTCHCGGDKVVGLEVDANRTGVTPRQLPSNGPIPTSSAECTTSMQHGAYKRRYRKRKKSKLQGKDSPSPPAKRAAITTHEAPCALPVPSPFGLVSPMKQTNSEAAYTCLRPIIRAVTELMPKLTVNNEPRLEAH